MDGSTTWGVVMIRWADWTRDPGPSMATLAALGATQVARHHALEGTRAQRFLAGRGLIAAMLESVTGSSGDLEVTSVCDRCGGDHGRPRHRSGGAVLSVSYAGDLVVVAAASAHAAYAVGVDIERDDQETARRVAETTALFAPAATPSPAAWTRIEAVLKADGRGLRVDPRTVEFGIPTRRSSALTASISGTATSVDVETLSGPSGYLLSVAVAARAPAER